MKITKFLKPTLKKLLLTLVLSIIIFYSISNLSILIGPLQFFFLLFMYFPVLRIWDLLYLLLSLIMFFVFLFGIYALSCCILWLKRINQKIFILTLIVILLLLINLPLIQEKYTTFYYSNFKKDCGYNESCFIENLKDCKPAKVLYFSAGCNTTELHTIDDYKDDECITRLKIINSDCQPYEEPYNSLVCFINQEDFGNINSINKLDEMYFTCESKGPPPYGNLKHCIGKLEELKCYTS